MLVVLLDCIVGFTDSETAVDILGDTLAMPAGCPRGLVASVAIPLHHAVAPHFLVAFFTAACGGALFARLSAHRFVAPLCFALVFRLFPQAH